MKKTKATSEGQRHAQLINYKQVLSSGKPNKRLMKPKSDSAGRNIQGRITSPHRGGGHKKRYRFVDFKYNKADIPARVESVEYDPNRTAFIGSVVYADGERRYVLLPQNVEIGDEMVVSETAPLTQGNRTVMGRLPVGTFVFNVETQPAGGAKLVRSAGNYAEVTANDEESTTVTLPSGEIRKVSNKCWATIGETSNSEHKLVVRGKAGRGRWIGHRPKVRGSAMGSHDHPHGGGEGRKGIALRRGPKTRTGKLAYGVKTRKSKKYSNTSIIRKRRNRPHSKKRK